MSSITAHHNTQSQTTKAWYDHAGFFILMLLPLSFMLTITTVDFTMTSIALLFLARSVTTKNFKWCNEAWFKWSLGFWAWIMFISIFAVDKHSAFTHAFIFIRFPIFAAALAYWLLTTSKVRHYFLLAITAAVIFASADVWLQFFTGHDILGHLPVGYRLTGLSNKQNIGGKIMMIAFPAIAYLANQRAHFLKKLAFAALIALIATAIFITGERTSLLLLALGAGLMFLITPSIRKTAILVILFFIVTAGVTVNFDKTLRTRMITISAVVEDNLAGIYNKFSSTKDTTSSNRSISAYRELFTSGWELFKLHPIVGVGVKQFGPACENQIPNSPEKFCVSNAQNMYLELLANTGIIGLILFMGISFAWFITLYSKKSSSGKRLVFSTPIIISVFIALLIRYWPLIASSSLFFSWCALTYWLMAGWLIAYTNHPDSTRLEKSMS